MIEFFKIYRMEYKFILMGLFFLGLILLGTDAFADVYNPTNKAYNPAVPFDPTNNLDAGQHFAFKIDNPAVGHLYFIIFNAISAMFNGAAGGSGAQQYVNLLRLAFMVGGFVTFAMAVGKTMTSGTHAGIFDFFKYLIIGTVLLFFMFSSKSTLVVTSDVLPGTYCSSFKASSVGTSGTGSTVADEDAYSGYTVGNFPTLLGWTFSTINLVGYELTRMTRVAFSDVSDVSLALNNSSPEYAHYLTGVNAILTTSIGDLIKDGNVTATFPDGNSTSDFSGISMSQAVGPYMRVFMKDCIFMLNATDADIGTKIQEAIESTSYFTKTMDDIFLVGGPEKINIYGSLASIKKSYGSTTLGYGGTAASQILNIDGHSGTCGEFWSDVIAPAIAAIDEDALLCSPSLAGKVDKGAMYMLSGKVNAPAGDTKELAINSGLFQMYGDMKNGGYVAEDISYATGKSKADFVMNNVGSGMYMAQMLPYLQMGIRAVLYAFFPFVFVVMLLPGGIQVLVSYLSTLIWVELWTPVAAILNLFLGTVTANKFQAAFASEGFNPGSALNILSDSAMLASVGGYLYASVPALTWLVLKGSGQMLGSITGAMAGGFAGNMAADSMNRDAKSLKNREMVNDFSSTETGKFLSMAEVEQTQAQGEGARSGAEWGMMISEGGGIGGAMSMRSGQGMKGALGAVADSEHVRHSTGNDYKVGGVDDAMKKKITAQELTKMGIMDASGNVNQQKLGKYVDALADEGVITKNTALEMKEHYGQNNVNTRTNSQKIAKIVDTEFNNATGADAQIFNKVSSLQAGNAGFKQDIKDFGSVSNAAQFKTRVGNMSSKEASSMYGALQKRGWSPEKIGAFAGMVKGMDATAQQDFISSFGEQNVVSQKKGALIASAVNDFNEVQNYRTEHPEETKGKAYKDVKAIIASKDSDVNFTNKDSDRSAVNNAGGVPVVTDMKTKEKSADLKAEQNLQKALGKNYEDFKSSKKTGESSKWDSSIEAFQKSDKKYANMNKEEVYNEMQRIAGLSDSAKAQSTQSTEGNQGQNSKVNAEKDGADKAKGRGAVKEQAKKFFKLQKDQNATKLQVLKQNAASAQHLVDKQKDQSHLLLNSSQKKLKKITQDYKDGSITREEAVKQIAADDLADRSFAENFSHFSETNTTYSDEDEANLYLNNVESSEILNALVSKQEEKIDITNETEKSVNQKIDSGDTEAINEIYTNMGEMNEGRKVTLITNDGTVVTTSGSGDQAVTLKNREQGSSNILHGRNDMFARLVDKGYMSVGYASELKAAGTNLKDTIQAIKLASPKSNLNLYN